MPALILSGLHPASMHVPPCFPSYDTALEHNLSPFAGYGFRAPNDCWASAWLVVVQSIWGQLLDAIVLGVIFARISHPKQRARTVFLSDSAVIARRDGILKFMFRVGDIRQTQACQHANPNLTQQAVQASMFLQSVLLAAS